MFAIGTIFLAILMWTLSAPAKFGLDYDKYKWLIVLWGLVCFVINAMWLAVMQENKNALAPEIENFKKEVDPAFQGSSEDRLDKSIRNWLELGRKGKAKNDKRPATKED